MLYELYSRVGALLADDDDVDDDADDVAVVAFDLEPLLLDAVVPSVDVTVLVANGTEQLLDCTRFGEDFVTLLR